ncbi:hypothetical protein ACSFA8_20325 [Variovorax sp. RT4R15]|uniref:hypothetical protein n=1 Tax=Variovorax sp. RT4R15 TaxID=3443737 RepID=UPI003F45577C
MIRQLKSIKQIEALLVAEFGNEGALAKITPKVALYASASPSECNWDVVEWNGLPERFAKNPRLSARVSELRQRYKAIFPSQC